MVKAAEALEKLRDGNQRFISGVRSIETMLNQSRREQFTTGQEPFAIILGCSDSRVPAEIVL